MSWPAGAIGPVRPAALNRGTVVELRDLFHATPARLKFLRSDRAEAQAIARCDAAPGDGRALRRLPLSDLTGGGEGRVILRADAEQGDPVRCARPAAAPSWGGLCRQRAADRCRTRGAAADRLCRAADLFARCRGGTVPVRQRPAGARQASDRGAAGGLHGRAAARPAPGGGAVPDLRPASLSM